MATDTHRGRIVLFGGLAGEVLNDTWEWDGDRWHKINPPGARPAPRRLHAMAYDAHRQQMILFGGCDADDDPFDDTWAWDGERWRLLASAGPDLFGHAMAFDAARRRIVLFGGFEKHDDIEDNQTSDDTWLWNGSVWIKVSSDGPDGRWQHAMAYDPVRQRVVLVAGESGYFDDPGYPGVAQWREDLLNDLWEWNGHGWIFRNVGLLPDVQGHAVAWDSVEEQMVIFGGRTRDGPLDDTRTWDGQTMRRIAGAEAPPRRYGHAMAFDPISQAVLIHGGRSHKFWKDTWRLVR